MDIKLDKKSLDSDGLYVIIPYSMENERVFGNVLEDVEDKVNQEVLLNMYQIVIFIILLLILIQILQIYWNYKIILQIF